MGRMSNNRNRNGTMVETNGYSSQKQIQYDILVVS